MGWTTDFVIRGFRRSWLADGHIVAYLLTDTSAQTINIAAEVMLETMTLWPPEHPYLALFSVPVPLESIPPVLIQRLGELRRACPRLHGRNALLLFPGARMNSFAKLLSQEPEGSLRPIVMFDDRRQALDWLRQINAV